MASEMTIVVMGYGMYPSFEVKTWGYMTIEKIKTCILEIIGERRPRGVMPAFSFQVSKDKWQDLESNTRLSDYYSTGGRVNVYISWDPVA